MEQVTGESFGRRTIRTSREALLQMAVEEPDLSWRVLSTLNLFRLLIAGGLLGLFFVMGEPYVFGDRYPALFSATAAAYALAGSPAVAAAFEAAARPAWQAMAAGLGRLPHLVELPRAAEDDFELRPLPRG